MKKGRFDAKLGKAGLTFFLTTAGIIAVSLLIAWILILIQGAVTFWAVVPLLAGFPITIFINFSIAKNAFAHKRNKTLEGERKDEPVE